MNIIKENMPYIDHDEKLGELSNTKLNLKNEIPQAEKMELVSIEDLINLISSVMSNEFSIYQYKSNSCHIYFIYVVIHDYYNYRGIPILIYCESDLEPDLYLKYQPSRTPAIKMTNKFEDANATYIKIIRVKELPKCLAIS